MSSRRRTVLLAWEMGGGLGHAGRLLVLAQRLQAAGWSPVVAARDPTRMGKAYAEACIPVIAAPPHQSCFSGSGRFKVSSFADMMGVAGYANVEQLAKTIADWDQLLGAYQPQLVIADFSPLLSLAVFDRVPLIAIGDGFVVPPAEADGAFPSLGTGSPVWAPEQLLDHARQVQRLMRRTEPDSLHRIVSGDGQVVSILPELDIYHEIRAVSAAGPWQPIEQPPGLPEKAAIHVYLNMQVSESFPLLQAIMMSGLSGSCFLPGASPSLRAQMSARGFQVYSEVPLLTDVLNNASTFIHHGGIGSLETAALMGRAQIILPGHREQVLNMHRVIKSLPGVVGVPPRMTADRLQQGIPDLLNNPIFAHKAQQFAHVLCRRQHSAWDAFWPLFNALT